MTSYSQLRATARNAALDVIGEIVGDAYEEIPQPKRPPRRPSRRPAKKESIPVRKSARLMSKDLGEEEKKAFLGNQFDAESDQQFEKEVQTRPVGPLNIGDCLITKHFNDNQEGELNAFVSTAENLNSRGSYVAVVPWKTSDSASLLNQISALKYRDRAKVTTGRIYSVAVHPSEAKLLVTAGDKQGNIGFIDATSVGDIWNAPVWQFRPHISPVNCLKFNEFDHSKLYSCAYDGSVRCFDLEKKLFTEVFVDEDDFCKFFAFASAHELFVATHYGTILRIDVRQPGSHAVFDSKGGRLRTIDVHPVHESILCTASMAKVATIWDWRKLGKPVCDLAHGGAVNSASFSPVTGSRLLTSSSDDFITVWDVKALKGDMTSNKAVARHNNHVGRWLTKFRPIWHPKDETLFMTGSMSYPRVLEVYNHKAGKVATLTDLTTVCSITAFHGSLSLIVGGNSSGYISFFA